MNTPYSEDLDLEVVQNLAHLPSVVAIIARGGGASVIGVPRRVSELRTPEDLRLAFTAPAQGHRFVFASYELGYPLERLPAHAPPPGQPLGLCLECDTTLVFDHGLRQTRLDGSANSAEAPAVLEALAKRRPPTTESRVRLVPDISDDEHARRIRAAQEHVARGDIYQANITRRLSVVGSLDLTSALAKLTQHNPVPHGAFLRHGEFAFASNSMETLLTFDAKTRRATSRPIKGTRARHPHDPRRDLAAREELRTNPKERAEHVMIVDLVRNDLGKVCVPGSVRVPNLYIQERYQRVWHGVSTVEGQLAPGRSMFDLIAALFPGGSITGAPKRRAMEIIATLEGAPRGAYTGSLAVISPDGSVSMSILIRTLVRDARGVGLNVGGGIVEGSEPAREIEETWEKAAVFADVLS